MNLSIRLDGADSLAAALESIMDNLTPALEQGVMEAAEMVRAAAVSLAPEDSGELKGSIVVQGPTSAPGEATARVTATAAHAAYVELGTYAQPAQPFLYPAYQQTKDAAAGAIGRAVGRAVNGG